MQGVRVLDFSHVVAGPVCGMMLGDMGADVTKIEPPNGELGRKIGPPFVNGESVVSLSVNRNKRGLAIDLKREEGRDLVRRLAETADVVIESFRPGVMAALGLGYDELKRANPALIYCSISAFGQAGPWSHKPGVDGIVQAVAGLMNTVGTEGGLPCKVTIPVADMVTGYLATIAILGALRSSSSTGVGQHLDISLFNSTVMLQQVGLSFFLATGQEPAKTGSAAPYAAPNEAFPTADGWMMLAAYQPERWSALCRALDLVGVEDDRLFATNDARVVNRRELYQVLASALQAKCTSEWIEILEARDIICAPIASYQELTSSTQYRYAVLDTTVVHPKAGEVRMPRFALGGLNDVAEHVDPPPLVGEHSVRVLRSFGCARSEIDRLISSGVVLALDEPKPRGTEQ
jgi:crotonobetainyl-CoA:carnitine CoA-transferase CaiB-like acyl-CoA transferase